MATVLAPPAPTYADHYADALMRDGYCIIPDAVGLHRIAALNRDLSLRFDATPFCKGAFYGGSTKRFGALLRRSSQMTALVANPMILAIVDAALSPWCDRFNLNLTQAIEIHPGAPAQFPHRDQDMWSGPKGQLEYLANVMWPLCDFTADNGATIIWPGSHRAQDQAELPMEQAIVAEAPPGSAVIFLGSTLHRGGANRSDRPRRGVLVSYSLGWLKPFENQWLCYPPSIAKSFDPALAALVGYSQHRPNLGNYEGQCPSVLLGDDVPEHLAATDALLPWQAEMLAAQVA